MNHFYIKELFITLLHTPANSQVHTLYYIYIVYNITVYHLYIYIYIYINLNQNIAEQLLYYTCISSYFNYKLPVPQCCL